MTEVVKTRKSIFGSYRRKKMNEFVDQHVKDSAKENLAVRSYFDRKGRMQKFGDDMVRL